MEKYVKFNSELNNSVCELCKKSFVGYNKFYIKRHLKNMHKINFMNENLKNSNAKAKQSILKINLNKEQFLKCCVGLVAFKNIPLRLFDDEQYFRPLIQPFEKCFDIKMNSKNLIEHVETYSEALKEALMEIVNHKMLSLKLDIVTRFNRSILAINIQYISSGVIHINTIGAIELKKVHTSIFLKEQILECLQNFNIEISQLYSVTTDNGANIVKGIKLQGMEQELDDSETENLDIDNKMEMDMLQSVGVLSPVRCAAHTLQLVANDVIRTVAIKIWEHRDIIKSIRTYFGNNKEYSSISMPPLDVVTNWNSTYDMINFVISHKTNILNIPNIKNIDWEFCSDFAESFKPLSIFTKQLQQKQCIVGDFYRDLLNCEFNLKSLCRIQMANCLYESLQRRRKTLLKNNAFLSALYLDPRFTFYGSTMLTEEEKQRAQMHLLKLSSAIKSYASKCSKIDRTNNATDDQHELPSISSHSKYSDLEMLLFSSTNVETSEENDISRHLDMMVNNLRKPLDTDVLKYWHKAIVPEQLKELAAVALAVPSTQVSVSRSYNAISNVLSKHNYNLCEKNISAVLLIWLNENIFHKINN